MAKALFLSLPLTGHINPSLPLVRELIARGEEITYYATEPFAHKIENSGAHYRPYLNSFLEDLSEIPQQLDELSWLLMRTTGEILDRQLEAFRAERPAYLITDSVAPWGHWIGEILGIPVVTSISTFAINRRVLAFAAKHGARPQSASRAFTKIRHIAKAVVLGRQLSRHYGVRGPGITGLVSGRSELNIVYTSRQFQPCGDTFDHRFQFIGPSMAPRVESVAFPWEQVRHPVIVYVSMGTLFNTDAGFYRSAYEAFQGQEFQVILSLGQSVPGESLGPAPANFIVQNEVPQLDVLRRAAVFVTHGGMNSVNESLFHGVPMVVIPQMSEQAITGRRVEQLGAGVYLAKDEVTPEKLRNAVRRIIDEPGFHRQAEIIAESLRTAGGVSRAADAIIAFSGCRPENR